jgi:hypothetical protein
MNVLTAISPGLKVLFERVGKPEIVNRPDLFRSVGTGRSSPAITSAGRAASRQATGVGLPCAIDTSIWRSSVTICSAPNLFFGMTGSFPSSFSHNAWFKKARSGQVNEK